MKIMVLATIFLVGSFSFAKETQKDLIKKHRALRHEEAKKWDQMKKECYQKYPKWTQKSHSDYDAQFKCAETVHDTEKEFNDKLDKEMCEIVPHLSVCKD